MTGGNLITVEASGDARARDVRRGVWLEYATVGWNVAEAVVSVGAGLAAGSVALVGFGIDSLVEVSSGAVLWWRLRAEARDAARREQVERRALRLVGVCFLALAAYVFYEAAAALARREEPEASAVGIAVAALSLVVMPLLARAKRRVAARLGSRALEADSRQTDLCAYLSAILLGGLALNALFGWWWADPAAALLMTPLIVKEGVGALRGETCCGGECH
ncbi:MAG TPA: cation transporter [Pyrinomonadaceae bacterium]|nr:cation transporter [Pyrinomonadaceae bacterium]